MSAQELGPKWWGAAIMMGGCIAILSAFGLSAIATPADVAERSSTLERQTRQIESLAGGSGRTASFGVGAVCEGFGVSSQVKLRQALEGAAVAENLVGARIRLAPSGSADAGANIAPVALTLEVEGPYDRLLALMDRLANGAPQIFVDSVDLTAKGPAAQLSLSGRAFCWTRS